MPGEVQESHLLVPSCGCVLAIDVELDTPARSSRLCRLLHLLYIAACTHIRRAMIDNKLAEAVSACCNNMHATPSFDALARITHLWTFLLLFLFCSETMIKASVRHAHGLPQQPINQTGDAVPGAMQ